MDKDKLVKMAQDSGLVMEKQTDGTYLLLPWDKSFADRIESAVAHKYETAHQKYQQDLIALRQKVQNLAVENIKLRAAIGNARKCLDGVDYDK